MFFKVYIGSIRFDLLALWVVSIRLALYDVDSNNGMKGISNDWC